MPAKRNWNLEAVCASWAETIKNLSSYVPAVQSNGRQPVVRENIQVGRGKKWVIIYIS